MYRPREDDNRYQSKVMKIEPLNFNYHQNDAHDFEYHFKDEKYDFALSHKQVQIESIELFQLQSFQSFGLPYASFNEDKVKLYSVQVGTHQPDYQKDTVNYSAVSLVPTELVAVDQKAFFSLVTGDHFEKFIKSLPVMFGDP
jgi:transglutaminase/protease-like cytokinesis protein 3